MSQSSHIMSLISQIDAPYINVNLADIARIDDQRVILSPGLPMANLAVKLQQQVASHLEKAGVSTRVEVVQAIASAQPSNAVQRIEGVKNIIAVASGKGGVGKSTVSVNLALALACEGARVGILDADIYGPSQPHMLGLGKQRPEVLNNNTIRPLRAFDVQVVSMGSLVTENTPMVWRGPMVSGALQQLLNQTAWDDVDYLIVDMPPGTGDIQLTLSQSVPVSAAMIVTTPQDIALLDARKGIEMFRKVNIPVLGIVENMATHVCSQCAHEDAIFGEHGGEHLAAEYDTELLGRLPLQRAIREQVDSGRPPVIQDPESAVSLEYRKIAMKVAADVWTRSKTAAGPEIAFVDD